MTSEQSWQSILLEHPDHFDPRQYLKPARQAVKEMVAHKIVNVLGSDGKDDESINCLHSEQVCGRLFAHPPAGAIPAGGFMFLRSSIQL